VRRGTAGVHEYWDVWAAAVDRLAMAWYGDGISALYNCNAAGV
jgi:hypothetical protein